MGIARRPRAPPAGSACAAAGPLAALLLVAAAPPPLAAASAGAAAHGSWQAGEAPAAVLAPSLLQESSVVVAAAGQTAGRRRRRQAPLRGAPPLVGGTAVVAGPQSFLHLRGPTPKLAAIDTSRREPPSASWFGSFSSGESTFDPDAVDHSAGSEPVTTDTDPWAYLPLTELHTAMPREWFEETRSGGPEAAWQTFYPATVDNHPRGAANPPWHRNMARTAFEQGYSPLGTDDHLGRGLNKPAEWFDTSVGQYDSFGRARAPTAQSDKFYVDWKEMRANATLKCGPPGCTANASLQIVAPDAAHYHRCLLTVAVHPTDFDDEFSREHVEWITVNGQMVSRQCDPMASGCVAENARHLHPCVTDMSVDHLLGKDHKLSIAAKLSPMVDECPVDGNLLSGMVSLRCLVRQPEDREVPKAPREPIKADVESGNATLRCKEPGCVANATVFVVPASSSRTCQLTVSLRQTDFEGASEEVEWVTVNGKVAKAHINPNRNPCREAQREGHHVVADAFVLLDRQNVTLEALQGKVEVAAKISDMVDECGAPGGYLLDAWASVECNGGDIVNRTANGSATNSSAPSPTLAPAPAAGGNASTANDTGNGTSESQEVNATGSNASGEENGTSRNTSGSPGAPTRAPANSTSSNATTNSTGNSTGAGNGSAGGATEAPPADRPAEVVNATNGTNSSAAGGATGSGNASVANATNSSAGPATGGVGQNTTNISKGR